MKRPQIPAALAASILTAVFAVPAVAADWNWPGWRGPKHNGHTAEKGLPTKWSDRDVQWKRPLKGEGQSSPVVWGERVFFTQSQDRGGKRLLISINRNDGRVLWEKVCWSGDPEPSHRMNGWASATPATDGKRVYAFFGKAGGLFCYTLGGELVWKKNLGPFKMEKEWGTAASPLLVGDLVIQNCDADAGASIIGLNKNTGEQVWKTNRDNRRGWSSPVLIRTEKRDEVVVNGHTGARAYNPKTGDELWYCKSFNGRGSPTVTPSDAGLVHVVNGLVGDTYAVRPGGSGNVTKTHMAWHSRRVGGRDLPSPIAIGNYLLMVSMRGGVLNCYDTKSGKELWRTRIGGQFSATPVAYDGLAAFIREDGRAYIVKPGRKANIIATNTLTGGAKELFRSSITPSDGQLFIRSTGALYCVGKRKSATTAKDKVSVVAPKPVSSPSESARAFRKSRRADAKSFRIAAVRLVKSKALLGLTRTEAEKQIGPPTTTDWFVHLNKPRFMGDRIRYSRPGAKEGEYLTLGLFVKMGKVYACYFGVFNSNGRSREYVQTSAGRKIRFTIN